MPPGVARLFELVTAAPESPDALVIAQAVMAELERRARPARADLRLLAGHALLWWSLGFGPRGKALLARWRREAGARVGRDRELGLAEAAFAVRVAPPQAETRLGRGARRDRRAAALAVLHLMFRGDPAAAVKLARAHRWFTGRPELAGVAMHVGWALAILGDFAQAERVLAAWKRRHARDDDAYQQVLRAEAIVAEQQRQYTRELRVLREALAICEERGLGMARTAIEVTLPCALAHNDDLRAAQALVRRWPRPGREATRPLDAGHDLTRAEIALVAGRPDAAERAARRALAFFAAVDHPLFVCIAHMLVTLAAPPARFARALAGYRAVAHRYPLPDHLARCKLFERLAGAGATSLRALELHERSRWGGEAVPVVRLLWPRVTSVGAGLYWDRVQGELWLAGRGPWRLDEHPVLLRVIEAILARPGFALPLPALFEAVWGMPYDPLVHEGKVHVTLHRLRAWLDARAPRAGRAIVVRDGVVAVADDVEVRVVDSGAAAAPAREPLEARILAALADGPLAPRELERRTGASRSALNAVTRRLLAGGRMTRTGAGRAMTYSLG